LGHHHLAWLIRDRVDRFVEQFATRRLAAGDHTRDAFFLLHKMTLHQKARFSLTFSSLLVSYQEEPSITRQESESAVCARGPSESEVTEIRVHVDLSGVRDRSRGRCGQRISFGTQLHDSRGFATKINPAPSPKPTKIDSCRSSHPRECHWSAS